MPFVVDCLSFCAHVYTVTRIKAVHEKKTKNLLTVLSVKPHDLLAKTNLSFRLKVSILLHDTRIDCNELKLEFLI